MLRFNIVAADFIEKNLDHGVYRVHETPESIKIDRLSQTLKEEVSIGTEISKYTKFI